MSTFGIDEEKKEPQAEPEKENAIVEFKKPEKKPFAYWVVNGREYRLKLRTRMILRLEEKFKCNLFSIFSKNDGLPPIGIMLTIAQAAMIEYEHGVTFEDVQTLFDKYCDEGGSQITFLKDVIFPTMAVSGFFTPKQTQEIEVRSEEAEEYM